MKQCFCFYLILELSFCIVFWVLAFQHCRQPLFLRLAFDEARRWHSYTVVTEEALATTVRASIWKLFARLEVEFGTKVVSHALGYITAARFGEINISISRKS